jgi:hypothetical protein
MLCLALMGQGPTFDIVQLLGNPKATVIPMLLIFRSCFEERRAGR